MWGLSRLKSPSRSTHVLMKTGCLFGASATSATRARRQDIKIHRAFCVRRWTKRSTSSQRKRQPPSILIASILRSEIYRKSVLRLRLRYARTHSKFSRLLRSQSDVRCCVRIATGEATTDLLDIDEILRIRFGNPVLFQEGSPYAGVRFIRRTSVWVLSRAVSLLWSAVLYPNADQILRLSLRALNPSHVVTGYYGRARRRYEQENRPRTARPPKDRVAKSKRNVNVIRKRAGTLHLKLWCELVSFALALLSTVRRSPLR